MINLIQRGTIDFKFSMVEKPFIENPPVWTSRSDLRLMRGNYAQVLMNISDYSVRALHVYGAVASL